MAKTPTKTARPTKASAATPEPKKTKVARGQGEIQTLLHTQGVGKFIRYMRQDGQIAALYKDEIGTLQVFVYDADEDAVLWFGPYEETGPFVTEQKTPAAKQAAMPPKAVDTPPASNGGEREKAPAPTDEMPAFLKNPDLHPVAKALLTMDTKAQHAWWRSLKHVVVSEDTGHSVYTIIGFQATDAGAVGAIGANRNNLRMLFGIDFRAGIPRILGAPRPKPDA
jgi:hypothetical protein